MQSYECQIPCLPRMSEGRLDMGTQSLRKRLGLALRRHLDPSTKRWIKRHVNGFMDRCSTITGKRAKSPARSTNSAQMALRPGDLVRVRSRDEIEATLDRWGELKGCSLMPEMWPYCDTVQRVLKPMERFFDERDQKLKKIRGIVLLQGTVCEGTAYLGQCDRSCFFFWRAEWLEKIQASAQPDMDAPSGDATPRCVRPGQQSAEQRVKRQTATGTEMRLQGSRARSTPPTAASSLPHAALRAGDLVRVRSREEIEATLDSRNELGGCLFTPEMRAYCGRTQRVLNPMERFLDERDYRAKRCHGVVLLEGAICRGSAYPECCDRSCVFFWREEWLEKLE